MTLYIHFGIYKAGSSYFQYICASQRNYLKTKGIYFPASKEDLLMLAGKISRGNAFQLSDALKEGDFKMCKKLLENWKSKSEIENCNSLLLSCEDFVHYLADIEKCKVFIQIIKDIGFANIKAMGFFRDLADHALSTYKHRAKTGKHPDYRFWIKNKYETPKLLENLANSIKQTESQVYWTLRKFQKNSAFLKQAFFIDWLNIDIPKFKALPNVNESVTLSEIMLLNSLKKVYPYVIDFFTDDLKALPKSQKARDIKFEEYVLNIFISSLNTYESKLKKIIPYFADNEKIVVGNVFTDIKISTPSIELSDEQLKVITERSLFFKTYRGRLTIYRRKTSKYIKLSKLK